MCVCNMHVCMHVLYERLYMEMEGREMETDRKKGVRRSGRFVNLGAQKGLSNSIRDMRKEVCLVDGISSASGWLIIAICV